MKQISHKIKSGLAWSFINQVVGQVIFIAFNIYLSRLLGPAAFGLIGMVTIFSGFASYFIDGGFGAAVIQKANITNSQMSTVFWVNIVMGILLFISFFTCAPLIAVFYKQPELVLLTRVIAVTFLISAVSVVQNSILLKQMNFKRKTVINWSSLLISYTTALVMAHMHAGYWAIVAYLLLNAFITALLTWLTSAWRPTFHFSISEFKEIAPFGLSVLGDSSINYWSRNADNFLIGKYLGSIDLGIYTRAYSIMMLPMKNISSVISSVMFPVFSSIQQNIALIQQYYLVTVKYVALICFPLMVGLSLLSYEFTLIFFGAKWLAMANVLQWLCVLAALQSILSLNGIIYKSLGKAKTAFIVSVIVSVVLIISFIIGIWLNRLQGLVAGYFIASLLVMAPVYATALKLIKLTLLDIVKQLKGPLSGVIIMAVVVLLFKKYITLPVTLNFFLLQVGVSILLYLLVVYLVDKKLLTGILKNFSKKTV